MTSLRRVLAPVAVLSLTIGIAPGPLAAAEETGTITIEQQSPNGILGEWILIKPENKQVSLSKDTYTLENAPVGNYTLIVKPPSGAVTTIRTFIDQDLLESKDQPQTSFTLSQNTAIRLRIDYVFTRVGKIGVNSQPPNMAFTLRGPNNFEVSSKTPASYNDMPEGQYTATFDEIEGCPKPKPLSDRLILEGRINFTITFNCEGLANIEQTEYERSLQFVTTQIDGRQVVFTDVPIGEWFASPVYTALKAGIMSGYRDAEGNLSGLYGPGDNVNIAQLAKIAHEIAGIDETKVRTEPKNLRARGEWFAEYVASAEQRHWLVFADHRTDPARPATRAEVVATLLQALDVRRFWAKGELFTDVDPEMPYADSIETAAADGVVSGFTNASGEATGRFGPEQPVNRAEIAKIIAAAIELYVEGAVEP